MSDFHEAKEIADVVIGALKQEHMGLEQALSIIGRGEEMAASIHVPMVFTVVDEGGNLVAMHRMDDSLLASISVSQSKAFTAVALRSPTDETAREILPGQPLYGLQQTHPGRFCFLGGGVPIMARGRCIGGFGVSGGTMEQDIAVARYGAGYIDSYAR